MQWGKSVTCTDSGIYPTYLHNGRNDQKQIIHTCKTYNLVGGWISPFENPYMQGQIWWSNPTPTGRVRTTLTLLRPEMENGHP